MTFVTVPNDQFLNDICTDYNENFENLRKSCICFGIGGIMIAWGCIKLSMKVYKLEKELEELKAKKEQQKEED